MTMKDGTLSLVVTRPLTRPTMSPIANSSTITGTRVRRISVDQLRRDDDHDGDQRPDREIELAGGEHEVRADREDREWRRPLQVGEEARGVEEVRVDDHAIQAKARSPAARRPGSSAARPTTRASTAGRSAGAGRWLRRRSLGRAHRAPPPVALRGSGVGTPLRPATLLAARFGSAAQRVGGDGGDDDHAAGDVLGERVDLELVEGAVEDREDEDASQRARAPRRDRRAGSRAAEHHRGDRLEVVAALGARSAGCPARGGWR